MPKDHYVAQTYLKHFLAPGLGNRMHAYNKAKLKHFTPTTDSICRDEGWDTNPYFEDNRAVDKYLRIVEPKWNRGVENIQDLLKYEEVKFFMAGYIAVLASCTPASIRMLTYATEQIVAASGEMLARQIQTHPERFPDIKPLPSKTFEKIMRTGGIAATVDSKHTHARVIQNLVDMQWRFYKSPWMILENETESPFLSSDFPVAYYYPKPQNPVAYRFVPISPRYAILINPSLDENDRKMPKPLPHGYPLTTVDICAVKPAFTKLLNKLTVQGAEQFVISAYDDPWILRLVKKYKDWKMDSGTIRLPYGDGEAIISRIMPRAWGT
jgi:Protein of unknown function (DUF4238)